MVAAVVLASGGGTRFGGELNKVYLPLAGHSVVSWSLAAMSAVPQIGRLVLTVRPQDRERAAGVLNDDPLAIPVSIIDGGDTRHESEHNAIRHLEPAVRDGDIDVILVHDAARPLIDPALIRTVIDVARTAGGAVPGLPATDVADVDAAGLIRGRFDDAALARVQTPQGFRAEPLITAYAAADRAGFAGSDTSSCVERFTDSDVLLVPGDERNIKLTYPHDLSIAEQILAATGFSWCGEPAARASRGRTRRAGGPLRTAPPRPQPRR
jgi:2-C-methyl-D-erythritol 4-phosphate cytidylyltransferase